MPTKRKKAVPAEDAPATPSPRKVSRTSAAGVVKAETDAATPAPPTLPPRTQHHPPLPPPSYAAKTAPSSSSSLPPPHLPAPLVASSGGGPVPSGVPPPLPPAPPSKPPAGRRKRAAADGGAKSRGAEKKQAPPRHHLPPLPPPRAAPPVRSAAGTVAGEHGRQYGRPPPPRGQHQPPIYHEGSVDDPDAPRTTNAVDEVINEVNHLLQSAAEAQALGRLRNSYSCLLLAHQRLVGVGRRVDRSYCEAEEDAAPTEGEDPAEGADPSVVESSSRPKPPAFHPPLVSQPPLPPALAQNYSDVAYVEHLARSAMELHHKRTGRGMQHDAAIERAAQAARLKRMEEEQIRMAARGVFALSSAGAPGSNVGGGDGGEDVTPTKRKGGRGKKPPTLVMHTMAGRNLDVRELMRGVL